MVIYSANNRNVWPFGWGRNDHSFCPTLQVVAKSTFCPLLVGKEPGRFDHDVHAELSPLELCGFALLQNLDCLAIHAQVRFACRDCSSKSAVHAVVLQQNCE